MPSRLDGLARFPLYSEKSIVFGFAFINHIIPCEPDFCMRKWFNHEETQKGYTVGEKIPAEMFSWQRTRQQYVPVNDQQAAVSVTIVHLNNWFSCKAQPVKDFVF